MNNPFRVDIGDSLQYAAHHSRGLFISELLPFELFFLNQLCELASTHQFHSKEYPILNLSDLHKNT